MMAGSLGDTGEARVCGLQAGHGAPVVQAVQHLAVVHDLSLVLWVCEIVPHVRGLPTESAPVKMLTLQYVGAFLDMSENSLDFKTYKQTS